MVTCLHLLRQVDAVVYFERCIDIGYKTQELPVDKFETFRQLHARGQAFIMPNPWDAGSAKIMQATGFLALATTGAGYACTQGLSDHVPSRDEMLEHCKCIVAATDLPVTADLGKGFGDSPQVVAETIGLAASIGLAGASIEDYTGDPANPRFDFDLAVERIEAAVEAKSKLNHDFVLTARCDNYASGIRDLDDTIKRLQAFERAGADVLYPPAIDDLNEIKTVCDSVNLPVNIVLETLDPSTSLKDLGAIGVTRVSIGTSLYLAATGGLMDAITDLKDTGSFGFLSRAADYDSVQRMFK